MTRPDLESSSREGVASSSSCRNKSSRVSLKRQSLGSIKETDRLQVIRKTLRSQSVVVANSPNLNAVEEWTSGKSTPPLASVSSGSPAQPNMNRYTRIFILRNFLFQAQSGPTTWKPEELRQAKELELLNRVVFAISNSNMRNCTTPKDRVLFCDAR